MGIGQRKGDIQTTGCTTPNFNQGWAGTVSPLGFTGPRGAGQSPPRYSRGGWKVATLFRHAVIDAMRPAVKSRLEEVVGLNSKTHKDFCDHTDGRQPKWVMPPRR